ncbi:hypothetical protein D1007_00092 [Hordeum vulgare]|nr:hypothetical protein D1007_00092 [Hordeum vulgare]
MPITSSLHWDVYKEQVEKSDDKSIELFATKVEPPWAKIDLNMLVSSPMTDRTSLPSIEQMIMIGASNAYRQLESEVQFHAPNVICPPPTIQEYEVDVIASEEVILKDVEVDGDFDEVEEGFHGIDIGDLDAYIAQKEMDRELPFRRLYGYDSDDDGPQEELDEDGFAKEENQIYFELTGLEKRTHLFRDLSLAHKVIVDGGMRKTAIEPTPCPDPSEPRDENEDENAYLKKGLKSHSEETADCIGEKMDYPAKVDEWLQLEATKSSQQQIITFDRYEMKYQIDEPGGTTRDGHSYGGAAFEVHLQTRWSQCERPSKYHWPCSHLITAAKSANISLCDGKTVRMQEFHVEATRLTWVPRFHPFLDQSQWPQYHGTHIKPDPALKVETKGRRITKRFRGDMDDLVGYTSMTQFGSGHLMEVSNNINCGVCDEGRHNTRTCKKRRTSKGGGGGGATGCTSATGGGDGGGGRTGSTSATGGGAGVGGGRRTGNTSARGGGGRTGSTSGRGDGGGGPRGGTSVRGGGCGRRGSTSARGGGGRHRGSSSARCGVRRRGYVDNGSAFGYLVNPNG